MWSLNLKLTGFSISLITSTASGGGETDRGGENDRGGEGGGSSTTLELKVDVLLSLAAAAKVIFVIFIMDALLELLEGHVHDQVGFWFPTNTKLL